MAGFIGRLQSMNPRIEYNCDGGVKKIPLTVTMLDQAMERVALRIPIELRFLETPVSVWFAADHFPRELISGFPSTLEDYR